MSKKDNLETAWQSIKKVEVVAGPLYKNATQDFYVAMFYCLADIAETLRDIAKTLREIKAMAEKEVED